MHVGEPAVLHAVADDRDCEREREDQYEGEAELYKEDEERATH